MLLLLFIIISAIGLIILKFDEKYEKHKAHNIIDIIGCFMILIGLAAIICSLSFSLINHVSARDTKTNDENRYYALCYKVENKEYYDENGELNNEVVDEINKWNRHVTSSQRLEKDVWFGFMFPNISSDLKTIETQEEK